MTRSRPRLGYTYRVIMIKPNGDQVEKTERLVRTSKGLEQHDVRHAEAMRVMKAHQAFRDAGCVVRMLRYEAVSDRLLDWSDDGRTWRVFAETGREYNETVLAAQSEEKRPAK